MPSALSATPAVLTVELESDAIIGGQRPPAPLTRDNAEILTGRIADDLRRILGEGVAGGGLIVMGALYDLTELLRPGLPMTEALLDLYRGSLRGGPFEAQLIGLGSAGGRFPAPELAPRRSPGSGPLLAVPFALVAPGETLDGIRHNLEQELLGKGAASLDTDRTVRQLFGVAPVNLSYATLHDLSALLKVQLEHAGFGDLWRLLEAGLYTPEIPIAVDTDAGNRFLAHNGQVWTPFLDFDGWMARHPDGDVQAYVAWQMTQRRYTAGLAAHGIDVHPVEAASGVFSDDAEVALSVAQARALQPPDRLHVPVSGTVPPAAASAITLTEQASPDLGPVAYTVLAQQADGRIACIAHEYPLIPEAIPAIRDGWQRLAADLGASFQVERPGRMLISGDPPRLMPWLDYEGAPN